MEPAHSPSPPSTVYTSHQGSLTFTGPPGEYEAVPSGSASNSSEYAPAGPPSLFNPEGGETIFLNVTAGETSYIDVPFERVTSDFAVDVNVSLGATTNFTATPIGGGPPYLYHWYIFWEDNLENCTNPDGAGPGTWEFFVPTVSFTCTVAGEFQNLTPPSYPTFGWYLSVVSRDPVFGYREVESYGVAFNGFCAFSEGLSGVAASEPSLYQPALGSLLIGVTVNSTIPSVTPKTDPGSCAALFNSTVTPDFVQEGFNMTQQRGPPFHNSTTNYTNVTSLQFTNALGWNNGTFFHAWNLSGPGQEFFSLPWNTPGPTTGPGDWNGEGFFTSACTFSFYSGSRPSIPATFLATGLPVGSTWSVSFDGTTQSSQVQSVGPGDGWDYPELVFLVPYGNYNFSVQSPAGYIEPSPQGAVWAGINIHDDRPFTTLSFSKSFFSPTQVLQLLQSVWTWISHGSGLIYSAAGISAVLVAAGVMRFLKVHRRSGP